MWWAGGELVVTSDAACPRCRAPLTADLFCSGCAQRWDPAHLRDGDRGRYRLPRRSLIARPARLWATLTNDERPVIRRVATATGRVWYATGTARDLAVLALHHQVVAVGRAHPSWSARARCAAAAQACGLESGPAWAALMRHPVRGRTA